MCNKNVLSINSAGAGRGRIGQQVGNPGPDSENMQALVSFTADVAHVCDQVQICEMRIRY